MNKAETLAGQIDALAALRAEKAQVKAKINASAQEISNIAKHIVEPIPTTASNVFSMGNLVTNGVAVYQGVRLGTRIIRSLFSLFRRKR